MLRPYKRMPRYLLTEGYCGLVANADRLRNFRGHFKRPRGITTGWHSFGVRQRMLGQSRQLDIPSESQRAQRANSVPVHVELIPRNAVPSSLCEGMVVVVPSFTKSQYGHPKAVARSVLGYEPLRTPHMSRRIH